VRCRDTGLVGAEDVGAELERIVVLDVCCGVRGGAGMAVVWACAMVAGSRSFLTETPSSGSRS
jgi:hypothetical protein